MMAGRVGDDEVGFVLWCVMCDVLCVMCGGVVCGGVVCECVMCGV